MTPDGHSDDLERLREQLRWARRFAFWAGAIAAGAIALAIIATVFGRTVVSPPYVDREFWISGFSASPEYLEDQSNGVLDQILSANPDNIVYRARRLARFAHPDDQAALAEDLQATIDYVKKNQIDSSWAPLSFQIDPRNLSVLWVARVTHRVGNAPVPLGTKRFLVQFRIRFGRLYLVSVKEIKNDDQTSSGAAGVRR